MTMKACDLCSVNRPETFAWCEYPCKAFEDEVNSKKKLMPERKPP